MKLRLLAALLLLAAAPSCAPVAPNADPVVVYAERARQMGFDTLDAFVTFEAANRTSLPAAVTKFADEVRSEAPQMFKDVETAEKTYKALKTPDAGTGLTKALEKVDSLVRVAAGYLAQYKK